MAVTLKGAYQFRIQGVGGTSSGGYAIAWLINNGQVDHVVESASNGHATQHFRLGFKIKKSNGSFNFVLEITGVAQVQSGASASFNAYDLVVDLPQGWTYTWASQQSEIRASD